MIYLSEISLLACWTGMAAWQAHLIRENRPILHGVWAVLSCFLIAGGVFWVFPEIIAEGNFWRTLVFYVAAQGCGRLVAFNVLLNWFRGLPWNYTSSTTGSLMDQLELRLFGQRLWLMEAIVAAAYIAFQFFI